MVNHPLADIRNVFFQDMQNASQLEVFDLGIVMIVMVTFRVKQANGRIGINKMQKKNGWD